MKFLLTILLFTLSISSLYAQPALEWVRTYDANGAECFQDIYAAENGDYIMCGSSGDRARYGGRYWLIRVNDAGDVVWSRVFGENNGGWLRSLIEADNNDIVSAGKNTGIANSAHVNAVRTGQDGEQVWYREYALGECRAIIETKEGNFLLAGENSRAGYLLMINGEGEPIWQETYPIGDQLGAYGYFTSVRETDGEVVVAGEGRRSVQELWHIWLMKINLEAGEVIWERHLFAGRHSTCNTIITHPDGGFGLSGNSMGVNAYLMKVNDEGEEDWTRIYDNQMAVETMQCLAVLDNGEFALIGKGNDRNGYLPLVIRTFSDGNERWRGYYNFNEEEGFAAGINELYSGVLDQNNSLVVAGTHYTSQNNYNGLIFKAEPSEIGPSLISWTPEDTMQTVIPGDSIEFAIHARHQWNMGLSTTWTFTDAIGTDTISTDTSVVVQFDELGDYAVNCYVSDGEATVSITWHIDVTSLYIESFSPDTPDLLVRRNQEVDFSVNVRAVEGDDISYLWEMDDEEIGDDDSVAISFNRGRAHTVEALAFRGEESDEVAWNILIQDVIVDWWPHGFELTVPLDTVIQFAVEPINPESDSLTFMWTIDEDTLNREDNTFIGFRGVDQYLVSLFAQDGAERDSLSWMINVVDPNSVNSQDHGILPNTMTLYPPAPNPFNSVTTVRYYLPTASDVKLSLFDVNGRLVMDLVDGHRAVGEHSVVIDGNELVSGVYFVRMGTGAQFTTRKLLLLK